MRVELCVRSGNVFIHSENDKDKADLYEFWVENLKYADNYKMKPLWTFAESIESGFEGDKAHVTLNFDCED